MLGRLRSWQLLRLRGWVLSIPNLGLKTGLLHSWCAAHLQSMSEGWRSWILALVKGWLLQQQQQQSRYARKQGRKADRQSTTFPLDHQKVLPTLGKVSSYLLTLQGNALTVPPTVNPSWQCLHRPTQRSHRGDSQD